MLAELVATELEVLCPLELARDMLSMRPGSEPKLKLQTPEGGVPADKFRGCEKQGMGTIMGEKDKGKPTRLATRAKRGAKSMAF